MERILGYDLEGPGQLERAELRIAELEDLLRECLSIAAKMRSIGERAMRDIHGISIIHPGVIHVEGVEQTREQWYEQLKRLYEKELEAYAKKSV